MRWLKITLYLAAVLTGSQGFSAPRQSCSVEFARIAEKYAASTQGLFAQSDAVRFAYTSNKPVLLEESAIQIWQGLGLSLPSGSFAIHSSEMEVVVDAILSFTKPGAKVSFTSPSLESEFVGLVERLGRVSSSNSFESDLLVVDELALRSEAVLRRQKPEGSVLVFRRYPAQGERSYLDKLPPRRVIESFLLQDRDANQLVLSASDPSSVNSIQRMSETRGAWVGKFDQLLWREFLERRTVGASGKLERVTVPAGSALPANNKSGLISDFAEEFPGFEHRNYDSTFDLGFGQPHVEISLDIIDRAAGGNLHSAKVSEQRARAAVVEWYSRSQGAALDANGVTFSSGVSGAIFQILGTLPRDSEILIPELAYPLYKNAANILGLRVRTFSGDLRTLEVPENVRAILLNFPHNPTGRQLSSGEKARLGEIAKKGVMVVNDLSYPRFSYTSEKRNSVLSGVSRPVGIVEILSASKDFGLPEARISAVVGDPRLIAKMEGGAFREKRGHSAFKLNLFAEALGEEKLYKTTTEEMLRRRNAVIDAFLAVGWPPDGIIIPEAGTNVTIKLPAGVNSREAARRLWRSARVMTTPGEFYGGALPDGSEFVRLSLSENSQKMGMLKDALLRSGLRYQRLKDQSWKLQVSLGDSEVVVVKTDFSEVKKMPPEMQEAFALVYRKYEQEYGPKAISFIDAAQQKLDPSRTDYLIVRSTQNARRPIGMGMMVDGRGARLPIEDAFPDLNFRTSANLFEGGRMVFDSGHASLIRQIPRLISEYLVESYGSLEKVPDDVIVYYWTINPDLARFYQRSLKFRPLFEENSRAQKRWIFYSNKEDLQRSLKSD